MNINPTSFPDYSVLSIENKALFLLGVLDTHLKIIKKKEKFGYKLKFYLSNLNSNCLYFCQCIFNSPTKKNVNFLEIKQSDMYELANLIINLFNYNNSLFYSKLLEYKLLIENFRMERDSFGGKINKEILDKQRNIKEQTIDNLISSFIPDLKNNSQIYFAGILESVNNLILTPRQSYFGIKFSSELFHEINLLDFIKNNQQFLFINKSYYDKVIFYSNNLQNITKFNYEDIKREINKEKEIFRDKLFYSKTIEELNSCYEEYNKNKKLKKESDLKNKKELKEKQKIEKENNRKLLILSRLEAKKAATRERQNKIKNEKELKKQKKRERLDSIYIPLINQGLFYCKKCNQEKSLDQFRILKNSIYGYSFECKKCQYEKYVKPKLKELNERTKLWMKNNPEKVKESRRKQKSKITERIKNTIKSRIKSYISDRAHVAKYKDLIGCSPKELVSYLESKFTPEMNWDNYGTYWNIDHIIPWKAFDKQNARHLMWCNNYKNLTPIKSEDNFSKTDYLPNGIRATDMIKNNLEEFNNYIGELLEQHGITTRQLFLDSLKEENNNNLLIIDLE